MTSATVTSHRWWQKFLQFTTFLVVGLSIQALCIWSVKNLLMILYYCCRGFGRIFSSPQMFVVIRCTYSIGHKTSWHIFLILWKYPLFYHPHSLVTFFSIFLGLAIDRFYIISILFPLLHYLAGQSFLRTIKKYSSTYNVCKEACSSSISFSTLWSKQSW